MQHQPNRSSYPRKRDFRTPEQKIPEAFEAMIRQDHLRTMSLGRTGGLYLYDLEQYAIYTLGWTPDRAKAAARYIKGYTGHPDMVKE